MNKSKALDPTSAAFLFTEKRTTPMHIAVLGIYKIPKGSDEAKFLQRLVDTVGDIERFRFPFGSRLHSSLTGPSWIADDDIDISYHLRRSGLATPGDFEQLFTLVSRLHGTSLDRERPLSGVTKISLQGWFWAASLSRHSLVMRSAHTSCSLLGSNPARFSSAQP